MCKGLCRPSAKNSLLQMHQCHEFVVNHVVWYVSGNCTWEEALRHLWGQGHVHRDDVRRLLELPNADAVPQSQIEDVLRATQGGPSGLTVRHRILRHVPNVAPPPPPPKYPPQVPPRVAVWWKHGMSCGCQVA